MSANPVLALVLFAVGVSLLWSVWSQWNRLRRVQKIVVRAWQYADGAFTSRRGFLPRLLQSVAVARVPGAENPYRALWGIVQAASVRETDHGLPRSLVLDSEQQISLHVFHLLSACDRMPRLPESLAALCDEARDREEHINSVRENWNDAAYAVRVYRRTFPTFLLARVLFPYDLPLFTIPSGHEPSK